MIKVTTLFNKLFLTKNVKIQVSKPAESNLLRGGEVGDVLPLFKVRDQMGKKITSEKITGSITKLIFLSDTCGFCFEVLQHLANKPSIKNHLVFKSDEDTYLKTGHKDFHFMFPIVRSTEVVDLFGVKRVPTILTLGPTGIIERIDEVAEIEDLFICLES
ncbi:hypothetical protein EJP82_22645 [Paenibacillus anaericanus]|uniref:Thioredoxin domain-containing protein n=1 Tax=Paenibacillus anaericanus TaxID=170367 RepID=A0A3S1DCJ4_9BACL|nr:hypothetical protein [Paenibacillus anaericanus]RUT41755.1 hypothetical protein EJP82_22645 [Paenibacillus anaericanus]